MRALRIAAIAAAVVVALVAICAGALLLFVNPNDYRGEIARTVQQRTGRPLTISGPLELKIFPWLALSVKDLTLGNPPGPFSTEQPFVTVRSASIGVKLWPLLGKRLEVSRIAVDGLTASLASRGKENNWGGSGESQASPASSAAGGGPQVMSVAGVDIRNASVVYRDELEHRTTEISNLEIHATGVSSGAGVGGGMSASGLVLRNLEVRGDYLSQPIEATRTVTANRPASASQPASAADETDRPGSRTEPRAQPLSFSVRVPEFALDPQAQTLSAAQLEARLGSLPAMTVSVSGTHLSADRLVSGHITVPKLSPRQALQSLGITPPVTRDPQALSSLALQADYRLTQKQLQLTNLDLSLDDTHLRGTAGIEDLDTSALGFELSVDDIDFDRYRAPAAKSPTSAEKGSTPAASGPAQPKSATPLPLETLRKLNAQGTLRVGKVELAGVQFIGVMLPLAAKDGRVHLGPTRAQLYGGSYNGDIVLDARPAQAQLSMNEHLRGTDVGALLKAALDTTRLVGHADANVVATATGNTDEALMRSLSGKIDANVKQGAIVGIDLGYELRRGRALFQRQAVPARAAGLARTVFNTLQGSGTLDKGVLRNDDLAIETDYLRAHGRGTLEVASQAIDYQLVAELADLKAVEIPVAVTGTLADPKVRPDIEALARTQLRQEVNKQLKKQLGDKLKDLFGPVSR